MTTSSVFQAVIPLIADLARDLPEDERYQRLLDALRQFLPADAAALLRLDGDTLVPVATTGLSPDTLGRRFRLDEHPRLLTLMSRRGATRFTAHSDLPDPYDGLITGHDGDLEVHDCLGCPLYLDDHPWGLLTLDALDSACFDRLELDHLEAFASVAAATVRVSEHISDLARKAARDEQLIAHYRETADGAPRHRLSGRSKAFRQLQSEIALVSGSDLGVLITGETGVGKELVAQAIHAASARAPRPMISINCAALPENLVESELFGHVRGAFSGATRDRPGKFELANGSTLFLDEIGELPLVAQAKLLRVLQSGQLQRVGSDHEHRVDVRIIAATNRHLGEAVLAGRFRADLYHRLGSYPITVPALRERDKDVLLLAGTFLEENRARLGLRGLRLDQDAQTALLGHDWPGNIRELEHLISRAALRASAGRSDKHIADITADLFDLPQRLPSAPHTQSRPLPEASSLPLRQACDAFQRDYIEATLAEHAGNWAAAARALGTDRGNLHRLARRLGLR